MNMKISLKELKGLIKEALEEYDAFRPAKKTGTEDLSAELMGDKLAKNVDGLIRWLENQYKGDMDAAFDVLVAAGRKIGERASPEKKPTFDKVAAMARDIKGKADYEGRVSEGKVVNKK